MTSWLRFFSNICLKVTSLEKFVSSSQSLIIVIKLQKFHELYVWLHPIVSNTTIILFIIFKVIPLLTSISYTQWVYYISHMYIAYLVIFSLSSSSFIHLSSRLASFLLLFRSLVLLHVTQWVSLGLFTEAWWELVYWNICPLPMAKPLKTITSSINCYLHRNSQGRLGSHQCPSFHFS